MMDLGIAAGAERDQRAKGEQGEKPGLGNGGGDALEDASIREGRGGLAGLPGLTESGFAAEEERGEERFVVPEILDAGKCAGAGGGERTGGRGSAQRDIAGGGVVGRKERAGERARQRYGLGRLRDVIDARESRERQ